MKVYIAGPITGREGYEERFKEAEGNVRELWKDEECLVIFNPVEMVKDLREGMGCEPSWEECMKFLIPFIFDADYIYFLHGWKESKGATMEFLISQALEKDILFEFMQKNWTIDFRFRAKK